MSQDPGDAKSYNVVVNNLGQYSVWVAGRAIPNGWRAVGPTGFKADCVAYINEVWIKIGPVHVHTGSSESQLPPNLSRPQRG
ncbi:MbtH family NRPS accessory protein [Agrobacterium leguminum]|uniref:MbtH family NRPS accessory protein n=1 Tax=Agrobacterium TaxID=357 RepID=UPI0009BBD877|nr:MULTISPECIES: MbtH family NRPS accessory protein [Agrobacterium]WFS69316.1 MbtH family NRPS accessory protein [Agrobacterium leguminum]